MDYITPAGIVVTVALSAAAVVILYAILARIIGGPIIGGPIIAACAVAPLLIVIPWAKPFPAVADAMSLFVTAGALWTWLYAVENKPGRLQNALVLAAILAMLKPEALFLILAGLLVEGWRRRREVALPQTLLAAGAIVFFAAVSTMAVHGGSLDSLGELWNRIVKGFAWEANNWVFAGMGIRTSLRPAMTYGATFYYPLLVPFAALAYRCRREEWFTPVCGAAAIVFACTAGFVKEPVFRACPPLEATMLVLFSASAARYIGEEFPHLFGLADPRAAKRQTAG
jgi:hypothetical protein